MKTLYQVNNSGYLAGPEAGLVTGATLTIDGGFTASCLLRRVGRGLVAWWSQIDQRLP